MRKGSLWVKKQSRGPPKEWVKGWRGLVSWRVVEEVTQQMTWEVGSTLRGLGTQRAG